MLSEFRMNKLFVIISYSSFHFYFSFKRDSNNAERDASKTNVI